eukprot:m.81701 g.81701  ORF g.81701 m.81701 type:complete len:201 (+) comp14262_c0_seq1:214-816(+)
MASSALIVALAACLALAAAVPVKQMHLHHEEPATLRLTSFNFHDCGQASDPGHVSKLTISPDPIKLPGNVTVAVAASLSSNVTSPIQVDLTMEKKVGVWVKIPCVDDIGSCKYDDLCQVLQKIPLTPDGKCPDPLPTLGVPCRCPLTPFNVDLPPTTFAAPSLPPSVPTWLSSGDYKISATANTNSGEVFCFNLELSLSA